MVAIQLECRPAMEELRLQYAVARFCTGSMEYKEPLHEIWGKNGGGALTQFLDRWHPVDPKADPYDPSTV